MITSTKRMNVKIIKEVVIKIAEMTAKMIITEIAGIIEIIKIIEIKNTTDVIMTICITEIEIETVVVKMIILTSLLRVTKTTTVNNLEFSKISNISNLQFWIRIQVVCFLRRTHCSPSKHLWTITKVVRSKLQVKLVCHHTHNIMIKVCLNKILLSLQL